MDRFFILVQILYKADDTVRLMDIRCVPCFLATLILINDRQLRDSDTRSHADGFLPHPL